MISIEELNPHNFPTTPEIDANLLVLLERINKVRTLWNQPMIVTSGLRSEALQQDLINRGISHATKSHHLAGEAVDIADDGSLNKWLKDNSSILEDAELWCEERQGEWQHFQIVPPKSQHRWFFP